MQEALLQTTIYHKLKLLYWGRGELCPKNENDKTRSNLFPQKRRFLAPLIINKFYQIILLKISRTEGALHPETGRSKNIQIHSIEKRIFPMKRKKRSKILHYFVKAGCTSWIKCPYATTVVSFNWYFVQH